MRTLSAEELLGIWEFGQVRPLPRRALMLVAASLPSISSDELEQMSIGKRDAVLLKLREGLFGSTYAGLSECPQCKSSIEVDFDANEIKNFSAQSAGPFQFTFGDYEFKCRLPNSSDLFQMERLSQPEELRLAILDRCLLEKKCKGVDVSLSQLPNAAIEACNAEFSRRDPQAEILLSLSCPDCNHQWEVIFDIVSFAWQEISVWAGRLLRQIHTIAAGYGWPEHEILALSPLRRQAYLEILRA